MVRAIDDYLLPASDYVIYLLGDETTLYCRIKIPAPITLSNIIKQWVPSIAIASIIRSAPAAISHEHISTVDQVARACSLRIIADIRRIHTYPYSTTDKSVIRRGNLSERNLRRSAYLGRLSAQISPGVSVSFWPPNKYKFDEV